MKVVHRDRAQVGPEGTSKLLERVAQIPCHPVPLPHQLHEGFLMTADEGEKKVGLGSQMCQFDMATQAKGLLLHGYLSQVWYYERAVRNPPSGKYLGGVAGHVSFPR